MARIYAATPIVWGALALSATTAGSVAARLRPETVAGWHAYVAAVEQRRTQERRESARFLAMDFQPTNATDRQALGQGTVVVRQVDRRTGAPGVDVPDGRVHHWRGAVVIPGVTVTELIDRIEFASPPAIQDDVMSSSVLSRTPGAIRTYLRLKRTKFVTVVYNSEHDVRFERIGPARAASTSSATKIAEVDNPGAKDERELPPGDDRGFLWRLNGYWRYEAVPGGVIAECESISLSRDVPALIAYVAGGMIDGTARESMERTLIALRTRFARS
jgi:hypothetical protein